jgi:hypothetical protein
MLVSPLQINSLSQLNVSHKEDVKAPKIISVKQRVFYFSKDESMFPESLEKISHINSTISNKIYGKAKSTK